MEVRISDYPKQEADYKHGFETGLTDLHSISISISISINISSGTDLLKATCHTGKVMTEKFVKM